MFEFVMASGNLPYTFGILLILGFALVEGVGLLVGMSIASWVDELTPFDLDIDVNADATAIPGFMAFLGWLCLSKLPLLVWIILFVSHFSISGFLLNYLWLNFFGEILNRSISLLPAFISAMYLTHLIGGWVVKIMPNTTTDAVSVSSFHGAIAVLTQDGCKVGRPVEAKLKDGAGTQQQVLVELQTTDVELNSGSEVILDTQDERGIWLVIPFHN